MCKVECNKEKCEHECNHCCCNHHREVITCPVCEKKAVLVPLETVKSLTKKENLKEDYYLCTNPKCQVVYFNQQKVFYQKDITTKVWYKNKMEDFIVCYCHNIKLLDIIKAVNDLNGSSQQEEILKYLKKDIKQKDCLHKNPTGSSCQRLLDNAIEFANEVYIKNK